MNWEKICDFKPSFAPYRLSAALDYHMSTTKGDATPRPITIGA